jgi:signal peptidase I
MVRSLAVTAVLAAAVYWPVGRLLTGVADPRVMVQGTTVFQAGDVVLVNHWSTAAPGRVVLYELPEFMSNGTRAGGHGVVRVHYFGERVERILAGPGDQVRVEGGIVLVNGRRLPRSPLALGRYPARLVETVPPGHYFILPTTTNVLPAPDELETWEELSNVPVTSVRGVAYARSQPLSRFEVIR